MAEGTLHIKMSELELNNEMLAEGEIKSVGHGILAINQWAIPHWDWVESVGVGAVKVNKNTAKFIIDRLMELLPENKSQVNLAWLNFGWSIDDELKDWECLIDFSMIPYKEVE